MVTYRKFNKVSSPCQGFEESKKEKIRREMKAVRASLTEDKEQFWNGQLFSCIIQMPEIINASFVYCYVSYKQEADTRKLLEFLWEQRIKTAVPRVLGAGYMEFYQIYSMDDLEPGRMGIPEPKADCVMAREPDALVITPGLAFDRHGCRIGYGGGFYDRFFAREPQHLRIGIAHPFQLYECLPSDINDERVDYLIVSGDRKGKRYEFDRNRNAGQGSIKNS